MSHYANGYNHSLADQRPDQTAGPRNVLMVYNTYGREIVR